MKYIFIDSNQYRHIFSKTEGFSDDVYELLQKLINNEHVKLLLPEQTKDEVERNRFYGWLNSENQSVENNIQKLREKKEKLDKDFSEFDCKKAQTAILKKINILEKERTRLNKEYLNLHSKQNQKLRKLFAVAHLIKGEETILKNADFRFKKRNPPYDNEKFGDALIWESLLSYLKTQKTNKPELIFVASDKKAWGDDIFHLWLEREFKERTNGRILYSKKLSDIPGLTSEEQKKIQLKENEDLKNNAVVDFVSSTSFVSAGNNANKLLTYKNYLTEEDYKKIFSASLSNHEIFQSFFTPGPIKNLFDKGDGYVIKILESAKLEAWNKFCGYYECTLKRQVDSENVNKDESVASEVPSGI